MKRLLIFIIASNLLFAGCAQRESIDKNTDLQKKEKNTSNAGNLSIDLLAMIDEETDRIQPTINVANQANIKKYVHTWGNQPLYLDKINNKLIRNHPTFLISFKNKNDSLANFEAWGGFAPKDGTAGCENIKAEIPTFPHVEDTSEHFITLNEENMGNELESISLDSDSPIMWCGVIKVKDKSGNITSKVWEFSILFLYPKLKVKLGRIVWDDRERKDVQDVGIYKEELLSRRIYRSDLKDIFPRLPREPKLTSIPLNKSQKAISVIEIENEHFVSFRVKIPNTNKNNFSYDIRLLKSSLEDVTTDNSEQLTERPKLTENNYISNMPIVVTDTIFTINDTGEYITAERDAGGSSFFDIPPTATKAPPKNSKTSK